MFIPEVLVQGVWKWKFNKVLKDLVDKWWIRKFNKVLTYLPILHIAKYKVTNYYVTKYTWHRIVPYGINVYNLCNRPAKIIEYTPIDGSPKSVVKQWYKNDEITMIKEYSNNRLLNNEIYRTNNGFQKVFYGYYKGSGGTLRRRIVKTITGNINKYVEKYFDKSGNITRRILYVDGVNVKESLYNITKEVPVSIINPPMLCSLNPLKNILTSLFK